MQPKHPWLQKCLEILENLPQIETTTTVEPYQGFADALLTIQTPQKSSEYIVEIKSNVTFKTLDLVIEYLNDLRLKINEHQRPLLVTDSLSDAIIHELIEKNIEFIDTTGNIYFNNSSLYILIINSLLRASKPSSSAKITASTLKIAYVLLQDPRILKSPHDKLAEVAGVDLRTAKRSLDILYKLNYLQRHKEEKYRIENYTKLLERWEIGYVEDLRSKLLIDTFLPITKTPFDEILQVIQELVKHHDILIGGELGAGIITGYLQPIGAAIHIPEKENYRLITTKLKLKPDSSGSITILRQFGTQNKWNDYCSKPVVDPLLIHAELALYPDERLKETANRIYDKYIVQRQEIAQML